AVGAWPDDGAEGEGWVRLGCGCEGCGDEIEVDDVRTLNGAGLELLVDAAVEEAAELDGVAGESDEVVLVGAVTLTKPGAAPLLDPGASGATRFGAPSSSVVPEPAGPPCRIPGATKANAAMAAVDRLPMAIGAGRSGLNGLRPRWRAL
ncbi:hypothetical protein KGQ20_34525, partial [Catenulispora sp. NF23]